MHGASKAKNALSGLHLIASDWYNKGVQNYFWYNTTTL